MRAMTRRERLMAIFRGRTPDRPAVKVWGAAPGQSCIHPAFEPVRELAARKTDLVLTSGSAFSLYAGRHAARLIEHRDEPTDSPAWLHRVTTFHTPMGDLRETFLLSTRKRPGYMKEHLLKEPADIGKLLSMPYEPHPFSADAFRAAEQSLGDAGIVMFGLDHPMYGLQRLIGSENFALWSLEADELVSEAIAVFAARVRAHAEAAIRSGLRGIFGWVGPELCIPPLMSPAAFDRYVLAVDRPLVDLIHEAGGRVWVHCHGRMSPVIERFVRMGVDVLNPIEPPPMGDMTMAQAFAAVDDRMGLEGGIETHDFMHGTKRDIERMARAALDAGRGRRLILCPSSGYMENVEPTPQEIENWLFYIEEGVRWAEAADGAAA